MDIEINSDREKITPNKFIIDSSDNKRLLDYDTIVEFISGISLLMKINDIDVKKISQNVYPKLKDENTLEEIDQTIIACATDMIIEHYNYSAIAIWLLIHNLHINTESDYLKVAEKMKFNINKKGNKASISWS